MASVVPRWRALAAAVARATSASRVALSSHHAAARLALPTQPSRPFSAQIQSQTAAIRDDSPRRRAAKKTELDSIRSCERHLASPFSSYVVALEAFEFLRQRRSKLKERHFLAVMEKASVEQQFAAVCAHFEQFGDALERDQVQLYDVAKTTWDHYQSERLQMHRHVLWAMLHGPPSKRFRHMQQHFRKHELATKRNRLDLYESDSLNFLLRMECTFAFADPRSDQEGAEPWLARVARILDELQRLRFRVNYSSSHALFHFLMHRPDVALQGQLEDEETESKLKHVDESAIFKVLTMLMDEYPKAIERDPRRLSLAISTAASASRVDLAVELLRDAETRAIPVDAASFAHVVAMAKDEEMRVAIADLYFRAKDHDRVYEDEDKQSLRNALLLYAIHDGNFTQIMELLHEMEYNKIPAAPLLISKLFASISQYRAKIRHKFRDRGEQELAAALKECPSVLQLMNNFPTVIDRSTHTGSQSILQALRSGDIDVALAVLRTTVEVAKAPLRAEVFSQVLYALLVRDTVSQQDVMPIREVEMLYDVQHPKARDVLNAQLLNLCESNNDLETMLYVLDNWQLGASEPLSKRALQRVFDIVSKHLKAIRKQAKEDKGANVRYKVGTTELSFRGILEKYPTIINLDAWTINNALMRSATAALVDDVATLLKVAHVRDYPVNTVTYKASLDVLRLASADDPNSRAAEALRECIEAMETNGSWAVLSEQHPDFAATLRTI